MAYTLTINGKKTQPIDVPAEMPLLWVLRDVLNMKGTKFGCGIGACGACTVHVNGNAVKACQTEVGKVTTEVTTIEGLAPANGLHALQQAWLDLDVPQCGYCQAGQLMSAAALLKRTPKPNDDQINAAMNGNVCRCGTYLRIREAIHVAAGQKKA
jgi:isoquinoline 1-oxidoreductase alpha subunit